MESKCGLGNSEQLILAGAGSVFRLSGSSKLHFAELTEESISHIWMSEYSFQEVLAILKVIFSTFLYILDH